MTDDTEVTTTTAAIAAAFTAWERDYRADPEGFMTREAVLQKHTPTTYGEACTPLFLRYLSDASAKPA